MKVTELKKRLTMCAQEHLLTDFAKWSETVRCAFAEQVAVLDPAAIARCQAALKAPVAAASKTAGVPPKVAKLTGKAYERAVAAGERELRAGRVAALLVAGGQGSRLGFEGPKGAFPIGPISNNPLFYFHARRILGRERLYGKPIPFYIMTSEANHEETLTTFDENDYFGLDKANVFFFKQGQWPGMTAEGKLILDKPGHIFVSPDGHGGLLAALKRSGALADMKRRGITSVFFFQVDNPLVDIADPAFIGYHVLEKSEYSLKLCAKSDPFEKVGMPMRFGKSYRMVEYSEMTQEQCTKTDAKGNLYYRYGSPAIHVFDRAFLEREADKDMPIHLAHKKIPMLVKGKTVTPSEPNGYKFEKFIFDILPNAKKVAFLAFDKADEFSPVKNAEGSDSPATCRADLRAFWVKALAKAGVAVSDNMPLEIDPAVLFRLNDLVRDGLWLRD